MKNHTKIKGYTSITVSRSITIKSHQYIVHNQLRELDLPLSPRHAAHQALARSIVSAQFLFDEVELINGQFAHNLSVFVQHIDRGLSHISAVANRSSEVMVSASQTSNTNRPC